MDNHHVSRVSSSCSNNGGVDARFHFPEARASIAPLSSSSSSSSSYWLDACEDADVSGFVDFGGAAAAALVPQVVGHSERVAAVDEDDPGFFSDLDRFLSSIKGDSLLVGVGGGNGQIEAREIPEQREPQQNGIRKHFRETEDEDKSCSEERVRVKQQQNGDAGSSDRPSNRAHSGDRGGDERSYLSRRHVHNGSRAWSSRKRGRLDWEESERRGDSQRSI